MLEPLQHTLQLCILHSKLARQLVPEEPDLFIEIDCIVRSSGNARRPWENDCNSFRLLAPRAALSRLTFTKSKGIWCSICSMCSYVGFIGQSWISCFLRPRAFDICGTINSACRLVGMIRVD
ncbi:hypothetical protein BA011_35565 (plasmid) [Rhizobium leguminosarum]|uniref:Uncharacterized protein n=1 Tax=Rhizobium leguminosarum TaxID=384 RepID=A0A1B1CN37_RHILE|nr:hypothetical protein BA011_35565 [Rhizobium leguminosarum]